jgi:hypothetical protein
MGRSAAEGIDLAQIRDAIPRYDGFRQTVKQLRLPERDDRRAWRDRNAVKYQIKEMS